jgi:hypothetical protein
VRSGREEGEFQTKLVAGEVRHGGTFNRNGAVESGSHQGTERRMSVPDMWSLRRVGLQAELSTRHKEKDVYYL